MRGKVDPKILIKVFEGVFSQERTRVHNNLKIKHLTLKKRIIIATRRVLIWRRSLEQIIHCIG